MNADLKKAVFSKVKSVSDGIGMTCYWDNVAPPTKPANTHLRVSVLPTSPAVINTCGKARYKWILQITIWVRDGVGAIIPAEIMDALAAELKYGTEIIGSVNKYTVTDLWKSDTAIQADGWYAIPYQNILEHIN